MKQNDELTSSKPTSTGDYAQPQQRANVSVITDSFLEKSKRGLEQRRQLCEDPTDAAEAVFKDILDQSQDTYFGRKNGLHSVRTTRDWKKAVPIRCYPDFAPYIAKILDGDVNVLSKSEPYALLKTSGSTGKPKLIPTTRHWRDAYRGRALYSQWGLYFEKLGSERSRGAAILDLSWERAGVSSEFQRLQQYSISQRPAAVSAGDWLPPWYHESWFRSIDDENYRSSLYRKLRLLATSDVRAVVTLNPSKVIGLAEVLAEKGDELIEDVRHGALNGLPGADEPNPERADWLAGVLRSNGGPLRLTDLWPQLSLVVSWNSASAALYGHWLEDLTPGIPKLPFSSTGTEGVVTIPVDGHPSAGPLTVDLGLYEFVPVPADDNGSAVSPDAETLNFDELEVGATYNVIMSQASGLYRYDLGDRYTVLDRIGKVPRLEFAERAGFGSSFTGEKLTEEDIHTAVQNASGDLRSSRQVFTCVPMWGTPPGYTVVIECADSLVYSPRVFAQRIETELQKLNVEYAEKRRTERLTPISVRRVRPGTFGHIEEDRRKGGASPAQLKHYWIQRNSDLLTYLERDSMRSWLLR